VTGPPPATAAVRLAVRRSLADVTGPVAAAVSGGADSLALAAALAFERPGSWALVVDHGLQAGSAAVAARAAAQCRSLDLTAEILSGVQPAGTGEVTAGTGPEAAARELRYRLLDEAAGRFDLSVVLLGHTLDDQAETVLLGLARGAGARALSGMAPIRDCYRRPLLDLPRATTRQACHEAGVTPWEDPHNTDPGFSRVQARRALPLLDQALGPGIAGALARTARQLREDADALDALAEAPAGPEHDVRRLAQLAPAVQARSLKRWAEQRCGRPLTSTHVEALRALVEHWHGQGAVCLPGGSTVVRDGGHLVHRPRG